MFSAEPPPLSDEKLTSFTATTQFTHFADEPRIMADFLPSLTGLTRGLPRRDAQAHAYRRTKSSRCRPLLQLHSVEPYT
jgi:hypothetical protein